MWERLLAGEVPSCRLSVFSRQSAVDSSARVARQNSDVAVNAIIRLFYNI